MSEMQHQKDLLYSSYWTAKRLVNPSLIKHKALASIGLTPDTVLQMICDSISISIEEARVVNLLLKHDFRLIELVQGVINGNGNTQT